MKKNTLYNRITPELENYSPWPKRFRILEGPVLIASIVYTIVYILISLYLWSTGFIVSGIQQAFYLIGFALFLISIYLTFVGFMFRSIK